MRHVERGSATAGVVGCAVGVVALLCAAATTLAVLIAVFGLDFGLGDFGDPGDGRRSLRLAVEVAPATELEDGTVVAVTSSAFGPNRVVGVAVCLREADTRSAGVAACDTVSGARYAVGADGVLRASHPVPRVVRIGGRVVDCAATPRRCLLVAADASDYDASGGVPISFRAGLRGVTAEPPTRRPVSDRLPAAPERFRDLDRGATVTVTAMGFQPGEPVLLARCVDVPTQPLESGCQPLDQGAALTAVMSRSVEGIDLRADERGVVTADVAVTGRVRPMGGYTATCTHVGRCSVVIAAAADLARSAVVPYTVGPG